MQIHSFAQRTTFRLLLGVLLAGATQALAQTRARPTNSRANAKPDMRVYGGARYHRASSVLDVLPYADGDLSATVGLEFRDAVGYWQLLLNGMDRPGADDSSAKRILTPQLHLVMKDRVFLAGTGVMISHLRDDEQASGWTKVYYQLKIGLEFDLSDRFLLSGFAAYPFKRWDKLTDFTSSDLEYTAGLSFRF